MSEKFNLLNPNDIDKFIAERQRIIVDVTKGEPISVGQRFYCPYWECFNFSVIGFLPCGLTRSKIGKDFNTIGRIWLCGSATRASGYGNSSNGKAVK